MKPIKRILVATDFSDCSREAVDYALSFAERVGAEVEIVHVVERPVYFEVGVAHSLQLRHDVDQWLRELKAEAAKRLEALVKEVRNRKPGVRSSLREGMPVDELLKAAGETSADLIVIGTHGRTGLPHVLLGSVAERVVRGAGCPVLTVRPKSRARP
ncbi:MAG: universal stress protein [Nitrospirota bacterium]